MELHKQRGKKLLTRQIPAYFAFLPPQFPSELKKRNHAIIPTCTRKFEQHCTQRCELSLPMNPGWFGNAEADITLFQVLCAPLVSRLQSGRSETINVDPTLQSVTFPSGLYVCPAYFK